MLRLHVQGLADLPDSNAGAEQARAWRSAYDREGCAGAMMNAINRGSFWWSFPKAIVNTCCGLSTSGESYPRSMRSPVHYLIHMWPSAEGFQERCAHVHMHAHVHARMHTHTHTHTAGQCMHAARIMVSTFNDDYACMHH